MTVRSRSVAVVVAELTSETLATLDVPCAAADFLARINQFVVLDQDVDVIVNAWNRNLIPWWLLLPRVGSGAIKRHGGTGPFKELAKHGSISLGGAVLTSAGRLPFKGIIHVAGINMLWRASGRSIRGRSWLMATGLRSRGAIAGRFESARVGVWCRTTGVTVAGQSAGTHAAAS